MSQDRPLPESSQSGVPYILLPLAEARRIKWQKGRDKYGPKFVGDPLEQLDEELLDAMNYVQEFESRGYTLRGANEVLSRLRKLVCFAYRGVKDMERRAAELAGASPPAPGPQV